MSDLHTRIVDILDDHGLQGYATRESAADAIVAAVDEAIEQAWDEGRLAGHMEHCPGRCSVGISRNPYGRHPGATP